MSDTGLQLEEEEEPSSSDLEETPRPSGLQRDEDENNNSPVPELLQAAEQETRVSYYVHVWDEMLETVLSRESYLFTPNELATVDRFQSLSYPARYLFIRLFVRRRGFFRLSTLTRYGRDVPDVSDAARELCAFTTFSAQRQQQRQREVTPPPPCPTRRKHVIVIDGSPETPPAAAVQCKRRSDPSQQQQQQEEPHLQSIASTSAVTLDDLAEAHHQDALGAFAQDGRDLFARADLQELAAMVSMDELKTLAKQMKLDPPKIKKQGKEVTVAWTRASVVQALASQSTGQSTLFSFAASSSAKTANTNATTRTLSLAFSGKGTKMTQAHLAAHKLMALIGPVIKLDDACIKLFLRLHLVFHRCAAPPNQNTLTKALLARFEKRAYPDYPISRQFTIFPDRRALLAFEKAVQLEQQVELAIEVARSPFGGHRPSATTGGGAVRKSRKQLDEEVALWQKGRRAEKRRRFSKLKGLFETSWAQWLEALQVERQTRPQVKDPQDPDDRKTYYMRRFTPGWVLTHCVFKSIDALAYFHMWDREAVVLRALLDQTYFCRGRRGKWWDRLALILMEHGLSGPQLPTKGEDEEPQVEADSDEDVVLVTRHKMSQEQCRREALRVCWKGLDDKWCHLVERHSLQRRVARLESMLKVPENERHVFPSQLNAATDVVVEGEQLGDRITGKKAYWKSTLESTIEEEELGLPSEVSVEELSLQHYRAQGWQGVHSENTVLTMLFGLLFFDILFHPVAGAFETRYQSEPLDLRSDAFAIVRHELIWNRLAQIRDGETASLLQEVDERERPKGTWCVGVRWDAFSAAEVQEVARAIGDEALAVICQVYAEDYEHRAGGVPDLFLWNPKRNRCKFSEVKGPGDRISKTQKVWIDVLLSAGLKVDKCSVKERRSNPKKRGRPRVATATSSAADPQSQSEAQPRRKRHKT